MKTVSVKTVVVALICTLILGFQAQAAVFISEVFLNPPGDVDADYEFIELMGTPGMKLDGYAIAVLNGTKQEFHPQGSIPPDPPDANIPPDGNNPEIDELFSLDGIVNAWQ